MRVGWKLTIFISIIAVFMLGGVAAAQEGADSDRGAELYQAYCMMCHGADGQGRVGANLQDFPGIAADAAMQQTIANGVEGSVMPAFGEAQGGPLSSVDIADITAYLTGVLEGTEPIAPAPEYQPPYRWRPKQWSGCLPGELRRLSWRAGPRWLWMAPCQELVR
jgi:cytochrome c